MALTRRDTRPILTPKLHCSRQLQRDRPAKGVKVWKGSSANPQIAPLAPALLQLAVRAVGITTAAAVRVVTILKPTFNNRLQTESGMIVTVQVEGGLEVHAAFCMALRRRLEGLVRQRLRPPRRRA